MWFDRSRSSWEASGYTIAAHTNSKPLDWRLVRQLVIHYTADRRAMSDTAQYLRNMQKSYVDRRGYSLGYNVAVDQQGVSWEIRGTDFRPAANINVNNTTFTVLCLVDWQDPCNPAMVETVRELVGWARAQTGEQTPVVGHRDVGSTNCPGSGIYNQIVSGVFEPGEDVEMRIIDPPIRVYDSRQQDGKFAAGETRKVHVGKNSAVFVNATVVEPAGWGFLTLFGSGPVPDVSNVNYEDATICNSSWVPVGADGTITVYTYAGCHVLIDVQAVAQ